MKILHLDYDDFNNPYAAGGQAYTTYELMTRLAKKHQITVITGNYPGSKNKTVSGVTYTRLGFRNLGYGLSMLSHWFLLPWYVFINQDKYDLIIECFTAPFTVSLVPLFARKPLIAMPAFFGSKELSQKYKLPLDIFVTALITKYTNFIVMTKNLANKVRLLNPNARIFITPGGVSRKLLTSKITDKKYGLYLGRIDVFNKRLDLLLEAWKEINFKLIVAGDGRTSEITKVKAKIKSLGLKNKVSLIGKVAGQNKINLLKNSTLVIQPSRFETFGYVALEALAVGKVLICFDIEGFRWIPSSIAVKIKKGTTVALRQGILKMLSSSKIRKQATVKNRQFAKQFNWDILAKQFAKQLNQIITN